MILTNEQKTAIRKFSLASLRQNNSSGKYNEMADKVHKLASLAETTNRHLELAMRDAEAMIKEVETDLETYYLALSVAESITGCADPCIVHSRAAKLAQEDALRN